MSAQAYPHHTLALEATTVVSYPGGFPHKPAALSRWGVSVPLPRTHHRHHGRRYIHVTTTNNTHFPKDRGGVRFFASVQAGFTPRDLWFVPATKVTKKQFCKDRNCQQCTMASRPLVRLASVKGLYIFCSLIGDFGHPVGRHGEGRERCNTVKGRKRSEMEHSSGVADTSLGDPCTTQAPPPLRRRV